MITTTAPTKSHKQMTVVSDVSLRCEPGTITGVLGANGAGRSTALKLIADRGGTVRLSSHLLREVFVSVTAAKAASAQEAPA